MPPRKSLNREDLLTIPDRGRPRWTLDELEALDGQLSLDQQIQLGAGLSNDDSAAWVRTETTSGPQGVVNVKTIRLRTRPSPDQPFGINTIMMRQLNGTPVELSIGGMNNQHQIAATARSIDGSSIWAVRANPEAWLPPTSAGSRAAALDIDDSGYIVGALPKGTMDAAACYWSGVAAAPAQFFAQVSPALVSAPCAVSPTSRAVAGNVVTAVGPGEHIYPWYIDQAGAVHMGFVNGINSGAVSDINDAYTCCGANRTSLGRRAWRWSPGQGVTWLRGLQVQGGEQESEAFSVNASGDAVGRSSGSAVLWVAGSMPGAGGAQRLAVDLNRLTRQPAVHLEVAVRINDNQTILCFGTSADIRGKRVRKVYLLRYVGLRLPFPLP